MAKSRSRRTRRPFRSFIIALIVVACIVAGGPFVAVWALSHKYVYTVETVPYNDVTLVFGASMRPSGPSPYLQNRLDLAATLYKAGKTKVIIVSGTRDGSYSEPDGMKKALVAAGVPADRIIPDYGGDDTYSSCQRARDVFGVTSLTAVTQSYHLPRAIATCRLLHIDAVGVGDDTVLHDLNWWSYQAREILSRGKLLLDAATHRSVQLDPPDDAVSVALGAH